MNNIIFNYLIKNYLKTLFVTIFIVFSFGLILNLFEEIEFFKDVDTNFFKPIMMSSLFVPSLIIKLLPFIIFFSSMWFITRIKNNSDLLILKVHGYSNFKIFLILATTSFLFGWMILVIINPITSSMVMYYEKTKSQFARDIEHLITFNNNGLWIKEKLDNNGELIISAEKSEEIELVNVTIFQFSKDYKITSKIFAKKADIKTKEWVLENVIVSNIKDGIFTSTKTDKYLINTNYDYIKINNLFNNEDTISFLDLALNAEKMLEIGYNKEFLNVSFHKMLSIPFLLLLMTALATVLAMISLKKYEGFKFFILGFIISVLIYYFKDFSLALGKTDRIPIILPTDLKNFFSVLYLKLSKEI